MTNLENKDIISRITDDIKNLKSEILEIILDEQRKIDEICPQLRNTPTAKLMELNVDILRDIKKALGHTIDDLDEVYFNLNNTL